MARSILTEHRDKLELLATTLKERETLERDEIDRLLGGEELDDPELDQEPEVQAESVSSGGGTQERAANPGLPPTRPGQTVANDLRPAIE